MLQGGTRLGPHPSAAVTIARHIPPTNPWGGSGHHPFAMLELAAAGGHLVPALGPGSATGGGHPPRGCKQLLTAAACGGGSFNQSFTKALQYILGSGTLYGSIRIELDTPDPD